MNLTQFCQFVFSKPGALFSVNRSSDLLSLQRRCLRSVSSAERWSGHPEPTGKLRRSLAGNAAEESGIHAWRFPA